MLIVLSLLFAHTQSFRQATPVLWRGRKLGSTVDGHEAIIGSHLRVKGIEFREGKFANLKVYAEPGDPYGEVLSFLRHGDEIFAVGYKEFAGQSWVQHVVDEKARGLYKGDQPRDLHLGWSPRDISGSRWLEVVDEPTRTRPAPPGYDASNVFARVLRGELPSFRVFETPFSVALLDVYPAARFHCLLISKQPSIDVSDLDANSASNFLRDLPRLVSAVKAASGAPGVQVISNVGAAAGQRVMHTHFHVIPRFSEADSLAPSLSMIGSEDASDSLSRLQEEL